MRFSNPTFYLDKDYIQDQVARAEATAEVLRRGAESSKADVLYWGQERAVLSEIVQFAGMNRKRSKLLRCFIETDSDYSRAAFTADVVERAKKRIEDIDSKVKHAHQVLKDREGQLALLDNDLAAMRKVLDFPFRSVFHESGIREDIFYAPDRELDEGR